MKKHNWQTPFDPSLIYSCDFLIAVPLQPDRTEFLAIAESLGCKWASGLLPTHYDMEDEYMEDTAIHVTRLGTLSYASTDYFDENSDYDGYLRCTMSYEFDPVSITKEATEILF